MRLRSEYTLETLNLMCQEGLSSHNGIQLTGLSNLALEGQMSIEPKHLQYGYVRHAVLTALSDTIVDLANTSHLPDGATYYTPLNCTSHFFRPVASGKLICVVEAVELGKSSFIWDATLYDESNGEKCFGRKLATYRSTHLIKWP